MDGTSRTCLNCQAELRSNARFCPKCGQQQTGLTVPAELPGNPPPQQAPGQPFQSFQQSPADTVYAPPPAAYPPPAYPSAPGPYPPAPARYPAQPYGQPAPPPGGGRQGFDSFHPSQPPAAPSGPPPGAQVPPGWPGPPRQPPRRHDGNRSRSSLALLILVPALVIIVVAVLLLTRPFSHPSASSSASNAARTTTAASTGPVTPSGGSSGSVAGSPAGSASAAASPTPSTSTSPAVTEQQAAASVDTMLAQSVTDRSAIISASNDVGQCGPTLNSDPQTLDNAARSRQTMLSKLSKLPGSATLPAGLISNLTKAWQASVQADQAYAQWANDEIAKGCVVNDTSDPGYAATETPNLNATKYKTAFADQWNPIAAQYGLTQYQQSQL